MNVLCLVKIIVEQYKSVLGKLPPRKIAPPPSPNSNANRKPNPDHDRGAIFRTPYKSNENKLFLWINFILHLLLTSLKQFIVKLITNFFKTWFSTCKILTYSLYNDCKKNLHEFFHIHHNQNANITLLEASITIWVTFSVQTHEDMVPLLQNLLTDRDVCS